MKNATVDPLIHLSDIEVSYPKKGGGRNIVLEHLNLEIKRGELVTVVGPSGSGKSTVLRMILGSQLPNRGTSVVGGLSVANVNRQRGIVYQMYSLFPQMTVLENIAIGIIWERTTLAQRVLHTPGYFRVRREAFAIARSLLKEIGLSPADGDKHPHELSGGMRQRVAVAQAEAMKPEVLLMDEPFGALDHSTREDMQAFLIEEQQRHGMTVLFVTHDLDEALFIGTRLIAVSQYWSHKCGQAAESARIVADIDLREALPGDYPRPHDIKYSPEFQELKARVHRDALDPKHLQHLDSFNREARSAGTFDPDKVQGVGNAET
jgi:NitT/TauT family transport system ATP-binding protein